MSRYFAASWFYLLFFFAFNLQAKPLEPFEARNAPVVDFVEWVSNHTGNNIILGRGVEGNVTVHVKSIDSSEVMVLFMQVMEAHGFAIHADKGVYRVSVDGSQSGKGEPLITKIYYFDYLRNTKALKVVQSILRSGKFSKPSEGSSARSSASYHSVDLLPASNGILVSANQAQIIILESFVKKIDVSAKQVLIEAVIVETDIGLSHEFSVNLSTALSKNGFSFVSNPSTGVPAASDLGQGGHLIFSSGGDIRGLITALRNDSDTKILSTPKILVMDREQGTISVGQNVPFIVAKEVTDGGNTVQQIERHDVGVTLSVRPHVLSSGEIVLQIRQESSSVTNSTQAADIITNQRTISTVAKVVNGQTIALGGLVSDRDTFSESGIPVLKDIPFIGALFRSEKKTTEQRELTVMIKTIIL